MLTFQAYIPPCKVYLLGEVKELQEAEASQYIIVYQTGKRLPVALQVKGESILAMPADTRSIFMME